MSELRYSPLDAAWVLIAEARGQRPSDFLPAAPLVVDRDKVPCPFCLIYSDQGPAHILADGGAGGDRCLAVANVFPALRVETEPSRRAVGPYGFAAGLGAHEVILETRHHDLGLRELPTPQVAAVLRLWRDRMADLRRDRRLRWISVFRNEGPGAGATLEHAHSQVLATPIWPERLARNFEAARAHYQRTERALLADIVDFERDDGARVVAEEGPFVAFAPYASRHAFEVWICPTGPSPFFSALGDEASHALARLLQRTLRALHSALKGAPINLAVHTAPNPDAFGPEPAREAAHLWRWRIEIIPRTHRYGGSELGAGLIVNPTSPEAAAAHLRKLDQR